MKNKITYELSAEEKVFLQCFRNSLFCDSNMYIIETPKSYEFWQKIANLSAIHHVIPMIYEQVNKSPTRDMIDKSLMQEWKFKTVQSILLQEKNTACFLDLYQKLENAGFHPLVVKGIVLRNLYCNPEYRNSSDEDFWIQKEELERCEEFLKQQGFEKASNSDKEKMAFDHKTTGFHIEVHLIPFISESVFEPMNRAFEGCFDRAKIVEIQDVKIRTLCDEDHMNYMIGHCFQHFLTCGVGIRQIADLMKYAETYGPVMNWDEVEAFTRKYNIYEFWKTMMAIAKQYLGFSAEKANIPEEHCIVQENLEELMIDILSGGIYGKTSQERICGSLFVSTAANYKNGNLFAYIWRSIFISPKQLEHRYPWMERRLYLLPIAWVLRIAAIFKEYRKQTIRNAVAVGNYRIQLAKRYHFM